MTKRSAIGVISSSRSTGRALDVRDSGHRADRRSPSGRPSRRPIDDAGRPPGSESWTYVNPNVNFTTYRHVIVGPTSVYTGPDAQFGDISQADRDQFAAIMTDELQSEIAEAFPPPSGPPTANTLRLNVVLIGAQKTVGGLATATRATPIGLGLNVFKSLTGKKGTLTGSLLFAVEGYNAKTGELLFTAVRRRTPDPLDIPATLSTTDTVKAVARDFADAAVLKLQNMMGVSAP